MWGCTAALPHQGAGSRGRGPTRVLASSKPQNGKGQAQRKALRLAKELGKDPKGLGVIGVAAAVKGVDEAAKLVQVRAAAGRGSACWGPATLRGRSRRQESILLLRGAGADGCRQQRPAQHAQGACGPPACWTLTQPCPCSLPFLRSGLPPPLK